MAHLTLRHLPKVRKTAACLQCLARAQDTRATEPAEDRKQLCFEADPSLAFDELDRAASLDPDDPCAEWYE